MSANLDAIVQEIRQSFEAVLESALEESGETRSAYEVEREWFTSLLRIGRSLLLLYFMRQCQRYRGNQVPGRSGEMLPYHSERPRCYQSVFGKFEFHRSYYYSRGEGFCPADAALNLPRTQCSDLIRGWAQRLAVCDPYGKSTQVLGEILGQSLWARDLQVEIGEDAGLVEAFYQQAPAPATGEEGPLLVVQADGKGVPILRGEKTVSKVRRGKGEKPGRKKEATVTAVYTMAPQVRTPESVVASLFKLPNAEEKAGEEKAGARLRRNAPLHKRNTPLHKRNAPLHKRYWASLEGKQRALEFTRTQAARRDGKHIKHRLALTDGSEALQERVQENFPEHRLILDFVHAFEYLFEAGNALFGETHPKRNQWVQERTLEMLRGQTDTVIAVLREQAGKQRSKGGRKRVLEKVANYYERNLERMQYHEYLAAGWPIATGVIEGACRHLVKDRCELSGMRWSQPGAEALLRVRCVEENGDWESFHAYRRSERQRTLYAGVIPRPMEPRGCSPRAERPHIQLAA